MSWLQRCKEFLSRQGSSQGAGDIEFARGKRRGGLGTRERKQLDVIGCARAVICTRSVTRTTRVELPQQVIG
eukprot:2560514-Lingulodinium_polyedra.AAC.1